MSSALVPCIRPVRPFGLLRPALDYGNQAAKAHALLRCRRQRLVVVSVRRQKKIPEPTPWDQLELNDEYYASIGKTKEEADEEPKFFRPDEIDPEAHRWNDMSHWDGEVLYGKSAVILAGIPPEEHAATRALLDEARLHFVKVVNCDSEMLQMRLADALEVPEIDWESPRIKEWIGNPGANRVALFAGLDTDYIATVMDLMQEFGMPPLFAARAVEQDADRLVGSIVADTIRDQRGNNAHISPASWEEAIRKAASGGPTGRAPSEQGFPGVSGATAGPTMSDDPFAHRRGGYTGVTDTQRLEMQEKIKKEAQERLDMLYQLAEADPARFEQVIAERGAIDMTPDEIAQFESELAKQRIKYGPEAVDAPDPTKPLPIPDAPPVHRFEKPLPFGKNRDFAFAGPGMSVLEDQGSSPSHRQNEEEQPAQPAAPAQQAPFGTALDVAGAQSNAPPAIVKEAPNIEAPVEADWSSFESIMTPVSAAGAAAEATQNAPYSSFTAPSLTPNMRSKLFPQPRDTQPTVAQSTAPAESDARATTTAGALATEDSAATGAASETRRLYQAAVSPALPPDYKPDDPWGDGDFGEAESDAQARAATRDAAQEQAEIERGAAAALEGSKQVKLPANFRRMPHPTKAKPAPTKPAVARSLYRRRAGPVPPEEPEPEIISLKIASEEDTSLARQHKALYIPMLARSLDLEAMKADEAKAASTTRNTPTADGAMGDSVEVAGKQDDGLSLEPHSFQGMQSRQVSGQRKVGIERTSKQRASKKVGNWKSIDPIAMEQLAFAANHDKIMLDNMMLQLEQNKQQRMQEQTQQPAADAPTLADLPMDWQSELRMVQETGETRAELLERIQKGEPRRPPQVPDESMTASGTEPPAIDWASGEQIREAVKGRVFPEDTTPAYNMNWDDPSLEDLPPNVAYSLQRELDQLEEPEDERVAQTRRFALEEFRRQGNDVPATAFGSGPRSGSLRSSPTESASSRTPSLADMPPEWQAEVQRIRAGGENKRERLQRLEEEAKLGKTQEASAASSTAGFQPPAAEPSRPTPADSTDYQSPSQPAAAPADESTKKAWADWVSQPSAPDPSGSQPAMGASATSSPNGLASTPQSAKGSVDDSSSVLAGLDVLDQILGADLTDDTLEQWKKEERESERKVAEMKSKRFTRPVDFDKREQELAAAAKLRLKEQQAEAARKAGKRVPTRDYLSSLDKERSARVPRGRRSIVTRKSQPDRDSQPEPKTARKWSSSKTLFGGSNVDDFEEIGE